MTATTQTELEDALWDQAQRRINGSKATSSTYEEEQRHAWMLQQRAGKKENDRLAQRMTEHREALQAAKPPVIDLDAIEQAAAKARETLPGLEAQAQQLAPEALLDDRAAADLQIIEDQIMSAKRAISWLPMAKDELERRQKRAEELEREREPHLAEARRLGAERLGMAQETHEALVTAFTKLRAWDQITGQQEGALRRAGRTSNLGRPARWLVEYAVQHAMIEAGCPPQMLRLESFSGPEHVSLAKAAPLPELDAKPIEPAEPKQ